MISRGDRSRPPQNHFRNDFKGGGGEVQPPEGRGDDFYLFFSSVSKVSLFFTHSWCRNNIIVSFQTEPTLKVLLISLKAGGWEMSEIEMTTWQLRWSQEKDSTCKQPIIFSSWTRGRELIVTQWSMPEAV